MSNESSTTINPVGVIRTVVPVIIGAALTWLGAEAEIGIDEGSAQGLIAGVTALVTAAYYVLVRILEKRVPAFGWLIGVPSQPVYPSNPSGGDMIPLSEAQRMAEDAATEAYRQIEVGGGE